MLRTRVLVLLLVLVLLIGCKTKKHEENYAPFIGGNTGLKPQLLEGAPPPVIQDEGSTPFAVAVTLANIGEAEVGPGTDNPFVMVRLLGFIPEQFGTTQDALSKSLQRKLVAAKRNYDGTILPGEVDVFSFEPLLFKGNVLETSQITMRADLCYDYMTFATAKICIKDDVLESAQDYSLCKLRSDDPVGNSGGPLQVVAVDQTPVGNDRIQLSLTIAHMGHGMNFRRGTQDPKHACEFSPQNRDAFYTTLFVKPVDDKNFALQCQGLTEQSSDGYLFGEIRLFDNAPVTVTCFLKKLTLGKNRVFQSILQMKLKYRYGEFIEIPIAVQDVH